MIHSTPGAISRQTGWEALVQKKVNECGYLSFDVIALILISKGFRW